MKDYYKILEVNKAASSEIISKVYKLLAKKYHPDMNADNLEAAEEKFKEISEAYEILSDETKRKTYDTELEEYEKQLIEEKDNSNYVPLETFIQLQEYCKSLEHSIAQLVSAPSASPEPPVSTENYDIENMSTEELEARLEQLKLEEKQEKRAKRIELLKNIVAMVVMLLFVLWFFKQNNGILNVK